jgi:hypothetical protein
MEQDKAYLNAAAEAVYQQLEENPGMSIPVDPDVAEHMGAFSDEAMSEADALEGAKGEQEEV